MPKIITASNHPSEHPESSFIQEEDGHPELGLFEQFTPQAPSSAMQVFSFFSGAGFLDLGFEMSSFRVSYVNEINTEFIEGYSHSRESMGLPQPEWGISSGSVEDYLSISKKRLAGWVKAAKKNALVGFVGGPPCPDFWFSTEFHGLT